MVDRTILHLRDYQQDIVARVRQEWNCHRSVMVQMPTGTGKTYVLAGILATSDELLATTHSILIVAHRRELIEQIRETIGKLRIKSEKLKVKSGLIEDPRTKSEELKVENGKLDIRVESIQTISRRINALDFNPDLVIIDEAHHALAKTYRILWDKWPKAKFLGLTATPCRMNRAGFTDLFDSLVTSWSIAEFVRKGVLSLFDYVSIRPDSMEQRLIDSLEKRGADGDYQIKEMEAVLNKRPSIERLYRSFREFAPGKKGIVYAISIDHARRIAEYYSRQGVKSVAIDSHTPREERKRMVQEFKEGRIEVLVNVDVFSEGFDCPDVEFVQMARPTLSLSKYLQQVGRGLRQSKGKEFCMLIDNVGLYRVFGLPVQAWDWERMFRGELTGKGRRVTSDELRVVQGSKFQVQGSKFQVSGSMLPDSKSNASTSLYFNASTERSVFNGCMETLNGTDWGVGMVISHETLLERLCELDVCPVTEEKSAELRAWQDEKTGLWGLKRNRRVLTEAEYVTVFDIKEGLAAVRFRDYTCGVVDEYGKILWKKDRYQSMRFARGRFLLVVLPKGGEAYVDLYNFCLYDGRPDIRRFGHFELLEVGGNYHSRTMHPFTINIKDADIFDKGFYLKISEQEKENVCLLKGDYTGCYRYHRCLADRSIIVSDNANNFYHVGKEGAKELIGHNRSTEEWGVCQRTIAQLSEEAQAKRVFKNEEKKQLIFEKRHDTEPFQSGIKWGLKVDGRIIVPPIYRHVMPPVGNYCAVEMNYSQWGIIAIDGTVLVEPKYREVTINEDHTALLTLVTGKKMVVKLVI